jgi:prevent-host-death family protein
MDRIPISKFKATCTAVIERVRATRTPIVITKRGKIVAELLPHTPRGKRESRLGYMAGTARIRGDLVHFSEPSLAHIGQDANLTQPERDDGRDP